MDFKPYPYQARAIDFLATHEAAGLFLDMGLGKTVITLTAVESLIYDSLEVVKVLVIAPLKVAEDTWTREADKWSHLSHLRISKVLGSAEKRKRALDEDADVYIINRENVVWLVQNVGANWPFDMVVIDELSSFKSSKAKRFRALKKVRPKTRRVVGLTGTPAANGLMDLWAEMFLLDRGERLGKTLTRYQQTWFKPVASNGHIVYRWAPLPGAMDEITEAISDITLSMSAEDYLTLPDRIDLDQRISLSDGAMCAYREMERDQLLTFDDGEEKAAFSAAACMNSLLQLANGFAYITDEFGERKETKVLHEAKLDALGEILEFADGPVLVFYSFVADRDAILARFPEARGLDHEQDITDWNNGEIPLLLAHPASVGYGLNLQGGGHTVVWYGLTWSLELYQQANARLHRQGQTKPVVVHHLIADGTIDEQVLDALRKKDTTQRALFQVLKDRKEGTAKWQQKLKSLYQSDQ